MSMFDKMMLMGAKIERQSSDTIGGSNWQIGGIPIYGRGRAGVLKLVENSLASNKNKLWIATVNPEFVMLASKNERFMQILHKTKLNVPDGIGLIWAREVENSDMKLVTGLKVGIDILRGKYGEQVVNGADLMGEFCKMGKKVFFLGGFGNRAEKTGKKLRVTSYEFSRGMPNVKNDVVIKQINNFEPDFLFVAYGMKKQEEWIEANLDKLKVKVVMGVGRSFDYYSGELKRAPSWVGGEIGRGDLQLKNIHDKDRQSRVAAANMCVHRKGGNCNLINSSLMNYPYFCPYMAAIMKTREEFYKGK